MQVPRDASIMRGVAAAALALAACGLLMVGATSAATSAALDGTSTGVLDDFNRPDEDPLSQGGAWASTPISGSGVTLEVLGNRASHNEGVFTPGDSYRVVDNAGDTEVYATMPLVPDNNEPVYLYLHLREVGGAGWDGYRVEITRWVSTVADQIAIQKVVNGSVTNLASTGLGRPLEGIPDLQDGDVFLFRRLGNGLELWRKNAGTWRKLVSASDPSFTHGKLGLGVADNSGRWDDFGGGSFASSTVPPLTQSRGICSGRGLHAIATSRCLSDPVNTLTGAFIAQVDDVSTPGTGVPSPGAAATPPRILRSGASGRAGPTCTRPRS